MTTELEWSLEVLDGLYNQYVEKYVGDKDDDHVVWLLKASPTGMKIAPNIVCLADVLQMDDPSAHTFWGPFGRKYAEKIQSHFGSRADLRRHRGVWCMIFITPKSDPSLISTEGHRFATKSTLEKLNYEPPSRPSPRRSPRRASPAAAPSSPSKRLGSPARMSTSPGFSPAKKTRTGTTVNKTI